MPTALVPEGARLYPVGRLDRDSEGLLLLTNDGAWSERVLHPRFGVEREYAIGLRTPLDAAQVTRLEAASRRRRACPARPPCGRATGSRSTRLAALLRPPPAPLHLVSGDLAQGWKRQLRRMFAAVGAPIERLVRVRIGTVRIDGLHSGAVRALKAPDGARP